MDEPQQDARALAVAANVQGPTPIQETKTEIDNLLETDKFSTAPLSSVNAGKESIVDSKNLLRKIKACMKVMKSKATSDEGKIKIADFICNKLCDI
jgi:hypothetical protein